MQKRATRLIYGIISSIYSLVLIASLAAYGYSQAYAGRVFPGTKVAGVDLSGLSYDAAADRIVDLVDSISNTQLPILLSGQTFTPTLDELGVTLSSVEVMEEVFTNGHSKNLGTTFVALAKTIREPRNLTVPLHFDEGKVTSYVNDIAGSVQSPPKDASVEIKNGAVSILPAEPGKLVKTENLRDAIVNQLSSVVISDGEASFSPVTLSAEPVEPEIQEGSLVETKRQTEDLIARPVTLTFESKTFTAGKNELGSWISFRTQETLGVKTLVPYFDDGKMSAYLARIAKSIDKAAKPKRILITTSEVLDEGSDGLALDRAAALRDLKAALADGARTVTLSTVAVPKKELTVYPGFTPGLYDGKYLEINLSQQIMYLFEGSTMVASYTVSTGKWSTPTPVGIRYVENHISRAWSSKYSLYMPYWMSVGGGYGIHELPEWRSGAKEGASHLGTPVSHGCIRLGVGPAEFVYNWTPEGTPVYIHR
jgi:vancomycin resistance protein YoaR